MVSNAVLEKQPKLSAAPRALLEKPPQILRAQTSAQIQSSIVAIKAQGTRPPLYFVHGVGGGMFWGYANLARHLSPDQPVYGFKPRGLDGAGQTIEEMAAHYVADLRAFQPHGPYLLGGFCFGGSVAYEMARQLAAAGEAPALLVLLNSASPNTDYEKIRFCCSPRWLAKFFCNAAYWLARFVKHWRPSERREFISWKLRVCRHKLKALLRLSAAQMAQLDVDELVDLAKYSDEERRVWETHVRALLCYKPKPYPGHVTLFRMRGHPLFCSFDPLYGWGALAQRGVTVKIVPGQHSSMLEESHVQILAEELECCLADARTKGASRS
ncbi:MAG: alpha/beta fold hydrolase [Verrucomicrobiota bacterium]|nr:alpha/beta fold hydrolase [Verrucomicrobiota bacterium]